MSGQIPTTQYRVVCPDGLMADGPFEDTERGIRYALEALERATAVHDVCADRHPGEPHRIERATWMSVPTPRDSLGAVLR